MTASNQQSIQEGLRLARAAVDQREPELAVLYTVGELTTICEALVSLEEQLEVLSNFAEACSEIIERSYNPIAEITARLDDVRGIAYPASSPLSSTEPRPPLAERDVFPATVPCTCSPSSASKHSGPWHEAGCARYEPIPASELVVLGRCAHGVDLDRDFCPQGCRV